MVQQQSCRAPVAQGIERLPPEQKAAGSNPAGGTSLERLIRSDFVTPSRNGSCDLRVIFCGACQRQLAPLRG